MHILRSDRRLIYMTLSLLVLIGADVCRQPVHSEPQIVEPAPISGNVIANPGFEAAENCMPSAWIVDAKLKDRGDVALDRNKPRSGSFSLKVSPNDKNVDKSQFLGVAQLLHPESMRGKRFRLGGSVRVTNGTGAVILAVTIGSNGQLASLIMISQDWPRSDYVYQDKYINIGPDVQSVIVGCSATGTSGSAWFDDITFTEDAPIETITPVKGLTASIDVNAGQVLRSIPTTLYGTNLEWTWNAASIWDPEEHRVRPEIMKPAKELGFGPVRFPGGFFSDYYHWRDGIGPAESRPSREHSPGADLSKNVFGTDELAKFCRDIGAEPLITVNMITGAAQEAADWVSYCNQPGNAERAKNGTVEPYNVRFWEIGNEQYLKGDDAVGKTSHLDADEYIRRYREWSAAMRKADPTIKLVAVGASNYGRYTMSAEEDWNKRLLEGAGDSIDYLSVHNAYVPADATGSNASFYEVYQALLAFPVLIKGNMQKINRQIETYAPAYKDHIKIAVTEWAPLFHILPSDKWIDHCKTLGSGIYVASAMKAFIESPRVDLANSFKLAEYSFMGWINGDGTPKPSYYALQMYTKHFGDRLIGTTVKSPTYDSKGVSSIDAVKGVPYLEAISSLSKDKSRLFVIVINKNFGSPITARVNLRGFVPAKDARTWTLTAPSLDANNGKDLIDYPGLEWAKQIHAPQNSMFEDGKPGTVVIRPGAIGNAAAKFAYSFPPISVTCIEMRRAEASR